MRCCVLAMWLVGCGSGKPDLCQRALDHLFELTAMGSKPGAEEAQVIDKIRAMTLSSCRSEGLAQAQADCILAAHFPNWNDQLLACPAFAQNPPSWVNAGVPRDVRRAMRDLPPIPDGPRESKTHYRELVARPRTMCGLTDAGGVQCWGGALEAPFPAGTFVQIATTGDISCGLEASGALHCASKDDWAMNRMPSDLFSNFALEDWGGCGVRTSDKGIACWSIYDVPAPLNPPLGQFRSVVINHTGACGLTVTGAEACFGTSPPTLPPPDLLAYSHDDGTCVVTKDRQLVCTDTARLGPQPTGKFDTVAMSRGHACATRTGGGTVCWGDNDDGACNVPQ